jgi:hypothetical protein
LREMFDVLFNMTSTDFTLRRSEQPQYLESGFVGEPLEQGSKLFDRFTPQPRTRGAATRRSRCFSSNRKARRHAASLNLNRYLSI